jgi:capsular polysaccharide biosynthesis protein
LNFETVRTTSRKLAIAGSALIASAVLIFAIASLYVWLAPKTYSAKVIIRIQTRSAAAPPGQVEAVMLGAFKHDRNVVIRWSRGSSLFEVVAFDAAPDRAVQLAEMRARELVEKLNARLDADITKIASASSGHPVRPKVKAILALSGFASLNLALIGFFFLLAGFLKRRAHSVPDISASATA